MTAPKFSHEEIREKVIKRLGASGYSSYSAEGIEHIVYADAIEQLLAEVAQLEEHTCCKNRNSKHAYDCARAQGRKAAQKSDRLAAELEAVTAQKVAWRAAAEENDEARVWLCRREDRLRGGPATPIGPLKKMKAARALDPAPESETGAYEDGEKA